MNKLLQTIDRARPWGRVLITALVAVGELINRAWVASVFFKAGMVKIASWSSTLYLFRYEYKVPLLPPDLAAYMGAATELTMPILLMIGLAGRFSAGVLVVFNLIAVISYAHVLNEAGIQAHMIWGVMLLIPMLRGAGLISVDRLLDFGYRHLSSRSHRAPAREDRAAALS